MPRAKPGPETPKIHWGAEIKDYGLYRLDAPDNPDRNPELEFREMLRSVAERPDLLHLLGQVQAQQPQGLHTGVAMQLSSARAFLGLAKSIKTLPQLNNLELIAICMGFMSTIVSNGRPMMFKYESRYLNFQLLVVTFCATLVYRVSENDSLANDQASQPRATALQILTQRAAVCVEEIAVMRGNKNMSDWVLGWVDIGDPKAPPVSDAIISRKDAGLLFDLIWSDRKNYLKAVATTPLPGFVCILFLLGRCCAREGSRSNEYYITTTNSPPFALLDILSQYWLVVPDHEVALLGKIHDWNSELVCQVPARAPELVDIEDSATTVQIYNNRLLQAKKPLSECHNPNRTLEA